jgi:AcrR family transcriptional regulator
MCADTPKEGGILITDAKQPKALICDEMSEKIIEAAHAIATAHGAQTLTVRKILKKLEITNRVFYNRFRNIDDVLAIVYKNTVIKVRESIVPDVEGKSKEEFFDYVNEVISTALIISYDEKNRFTQYVFDNDSVTQSNYRWWTGEIKKIIDYAKAKDYIKDVDSDVLSYTIWCFCRGYNADAVGRGVPREKALADFKYSFAFLLNGLKK